MKTCPECGQPVDDDWKEYRCACGCGISCPADDPKAEEKIEKWKEQHKCKGGEMGDQIATKTVLVNIQENGIIRLNSTSLLIAKLEKEIDYDRIVPCELEAANAALQKQVEDLKCCGNCIKHHEDMNAVRMDRCNSRKWNHYCERWQSDNMTREDRK